MITGTYNLIANPSWALTQLQEVRLECDTTLGPVTINLPAISTLAQSTNLKLFIVDATANANVNNITINAGTNGLPPVSDTFDDSTTTTLVLNKDGSSVSIQNVAGTQWIAIESISAGGVNVNTILVSGPFTPNSQSALLPTTSTITDAIGPTDFDVYNFSAVVTVTGNSVYAEIMGFISVTPGNFVALGSQKGIFDSNDEFIAGYPITTTTPLTNFGLVTDTTSGPVPFATAVNLATVILDNQILSTDDYFLTLLLDGGGAFDFETSAVVQMEVFVTSGATVTYTPA
jgi:hypothetical protein